MLKNQVFPYYRKCSLELEKLYTYLQYNYNANSVDELCKLRGYVDTMQHDCLTEMGIGIAPPLDISGIVDEDLKSELGLFTEEGHFLLEDRFIIPVEDANGVLVSLIGYYPDKKKYITLPTPFFSKECMFFNYKQAFELSWEKYEGLVFLVEGIFDCISLRALGLPCIATMGSTVSKNKGELLKLFKRVIAIPDNDKTGRKALNRYTSRGWQVPSNTTMIKFVGGEVEMGGELLHCKDMDNLVSWFDADDVREMLLSLVELKEEVEELKL